MRRLCCCEQPAVVLPINPMDAAYKIRSEEVGTAVPNKNKVHVEKSKTPTEHSMDTRSNVGDVDGPTHPRASWTVQLYGTIFEQIIHL